MHVLDLFGEESQPLNEGAVKNRDIERQDYENMSGREFLAAYKMGKAEWALKNPDIVPKKSKPKTTKSVNENSGNTRAKLAKIIAREMKTARSNELTKTQRKHAFAVLTRAKEAKRMLDAGADESAAWAHFQGTKQEMAEGKWFRTTYGWAGGEKPGGGKYVHPEVAAERRREKAKKKREQERQAKSGTGARPTTSTHCPGCYSTDIKTYSDGEKECHQCHKTWHVKGVAEGKFQHTFNRKDVARTLLQLQQVEDSGLSGRKLASALHGNVFIKRDFLERFLPKLVKKGIISSLDGIYKITPAGAEWIAKFPKDTLYVRDNVNEQGVAEGYWKDAIQDVEAARKAREGKPFEKNPLSHDERGVYIGDKDLAGNPVPTPKEKDMAETKPGLYANVHAKRERIKQGSGERMRKPGTAGAPTAQAWRDAAKTAKKESAENNMKSVKEESLPEELFKTKSEIENPVDTVKMDIPLLIRIMEYAREDAKTDLELHDVAERLISLGKAGNTLSMRDYDKIVGTEAKAMINNKL